MPSRSHFSIRKLLGTPRRRSTAATSDIDVEGGRTDTDYDISYFKRDSRSSGSSGSIASSLSISAKRISDGAATEGLNQAEVDHIKVAVAAATVDSNLRFRTSGGERTDVKDGSEQQAIDGIPLVDDQKTRKRVRPALAPIIVHRHSEILRQQAEPVTAGTTTTTTKAEGSQKQQPSGGEKYQESHYSNTQAAVRLQPTSSLCVCEKRAHPLQQQQQHQQQQRLLTGSRHGSLCSFNGENFIHQKHAALDHVADQCQLHKCSFLSHSSPSSPSLQSWRQTPPLSSSSFLSTPKTSLTWPSPPLPVPLIFVPGVQVSSPAQSPPVDTSLSCPNTPFSHASPFNAFASPAKTRLPQDISTFSTGEVLIPRHQNQKQQETEKLNYTSDGKTDSGVHIDQTGDLSNAQIDIDLNRELRKRESLFGFSEGPILDLFEALTIEPEEAVLLRKECQQQYQPHHFRRTVGMDGQLPPTPPRSSSDAVFSAAYRSVAARTGPVDGVCISPTFTRPRPAPTPTSRCKELAMPPAPLAPPYIPPSTAGIPSMATVLLSSPKKPAKFSPLRIRPAALARKPSTAASRAQRKRPMKSRRREQAVGNIAVSGAIVVPSRLPRVDMQPETLSLSKTSSRESTQKRYSGGSRWLLTDNVAELFSSRLFGRMEVNEMLPPEKLKEIRESRASIAAAEAAAEMEVEMATESTTEAEAAAEIAAEAALEAAMEAAAGEAGNLILSIRRKLDTETEWPMKKKKYPEQEQKQKQEREREPSDQKPPQKEPRQPSPPTRPPPPISHLASSPRLTELISTVETDGCETPVEPFHLQDLPRRIGAAGVRLSILLPTDEEAISFDNSRAITKRKRTEAVRVAEPDEPMGTHETNKGKANETTGNVSSSLSPQRNQQRASKDKSKTMPTIPESTVTDVNSNTYRPEAIGRRPAGADRTRLDDTTSTAMTPTATTDADYISFPATPFSLVMPTYRHGPIRLAKVDSGTVEPKVVEEARCQKHTPWIATDDTLDWTAFQMAILGGAGDFFSDSIDYGRASADADEVDDLACWFHSLGIAHERLLEGESEEEEEEEEMDEPEAGAWTKAESRAEGPQVVPALTSNRHSGGSYRGSFESGSSGSSGNGSGNGSGSSSSSSVYSSDGAAALAAGPGNGLLPAYAISAPEKVAGQLLQAPGPPPGIAKMPATRTPPPPAPALPTAQFGLHWTRRSSGASFDSYESMPQSPMADVVMSCAADGSQYAVPMGYNLGHDIGEFLRWESENVCRAP